MEGLYVERELRNREPVEDPFGFDSLPESRLFLRKTEGVGGLCGDVSRIRSPVTRLVT